MFCIPIYLYNSCSTGAVLLSLMFLLVNTNFWCPGTKEVTDYKQNTEKCKHFKYVSFHAVTQYKLSFSLIIPSN